MAEGIYKITEQFEQELCKYTKAPFAVALDSCSNALFLSLLYENIKGKEVRIPCHTFVSVPCEIIHAGGRVVFKYPVPGQKDTLKGAYQLYPTRIWDSALRFTYDMYMPDTFMCLSFTGPYKHLKLGKAGAILTDNENAYKWFKRMRISGRNEVPFYKDHFDMIGYNMYILPEIALRGIFFMRQFYEEDGTPIHNEDLELTYPDLSQFEIYTNF